MGNGDTRQRLILAAERLFAHNGIQGVSLREINIAAGQRNTSASHYHFGSKEALLMAVLENRDGQLRDRRMQRLEAIARAAPADPAHAVAEALVLPAADMMDSAPDYILFTAQLFLQPPSDWRELLTREESALSHATRILAARTSIPEPLVMHRLVTMMQHLTTALASHIRVSKDGGDQSIALPRPLFLSNLIDGLAAYLLVNPSKRTLGLMAEGSMGDFSQ
ncbi:MAG: TetR/AcrR family transcriptional regulator [Myxococcales bacterium]|nr:TetR/AcrR family transcriptional regulator [Myxococcales bacterium]MDD9964746.1 TetR/AcrR family transcriptional regulator [Myxococcales bacterium]